MSAAMSSAISRTSIGPIDVGGPAVALQVDRDHLVVRGERRQHRPEHLARPEPAVEQDQRPAGAVGLVVEVDAVDVGVLPGALRLRSSNRWCGHGVLLGWWRGGSVPIRPRETGKLIASLELAPGGRSRWSWGRRRDAPTPRVDSDEDPRPTHRRHSGRATRRRVRAVVVGDRLPRRDRDVVARPDDHADHRADDFAQPRDTHAASTHGRSARGVRADDQQPIRDHPG